MQETNCLLSGLFVHPIKSCAAVAVSESLLIETGLDLDRAWMVVDKAGEMLTQRELPRMALIQPQFKGDEMVLRAPGMLALHLRLDVVEQPTRVRVWDDVVKAFDMGSLAAQWFTDFLQRPLQLVRFDPEQKRLSDLQWTGELQAENAFSDGYPLLVANEASVVDLNARMQAANPGKNAPAATMQRFRPNLVLSGLQAFDEDHVRSIRIDTEEGPVQLQLVKPCTRCSIPNVDPLTGETGHEPGATLAGFRVDPRVKGGITFGMNAVVLTGLEHVLRVGQRAQVEYDF